MKNKISIKNIIRDNASWVVFVLLTVVFSFITPRFLTVNNAITILKQISVNGIAAVGLSFILISGGIDLSTGSQIAFSGMVCSLLIVKFGLNTYLAILLTMMINSAVIGASNGTVIAITNMPPLIATLGMQNVGRGLAYLTNDGYTVYGLPEPAKLFGQGSIGVIPFSAVLLLIAMVIGSFVLNKTTYGRKIFAVGSNREAARLSGIPVRLIRISTYVIGSLFIGFSGIVQMSRMNCGLPTAGLELYIEILTACVIGGISSRGGQGRIFGMLGGVLTMGVISNGMNVAGISEYWQFVAKGAILIASVGFDSYKTNVLAERKRNIIRSSTERH